MTDAMVPWVTYERDRASDDRLRALEREAFKDVLQEIRGDIADVRSDVAEIKANDKRRLGVLIASLLIPLGTALIMLYVTIQVTSR